MRARPDGSWQIELNTDNLPRVLVNNAYLAQVSRRGASKEDRSYINQCQQSANWLVKALHQRATTILKVSTEIVRQQEGFSCRRALSQTAGLTRYRRGHRNA